MQNLILGTILTPLSSARADAETPSFYHEPDGAILVASGKIKDLGPADVLRKKYPQAKRHEHKEALILPGFIDAHVHYPQTAIIASWGKRLIDWLNTYTFPEEAKFHDPDYAKEIAQRYVDLAIAHGTTGFATFSTIHPTSVDAIFEEGSKRDMMSIAGKTCMDRHAPENLMDTPEIAYDESKSLIEKWHEKGRNIYAITPRFAPTSSPEQLEALGQLWAEHPSCLMQTHLSEQKEEIDWVASLFPQAKGYLDVYESFGLLGKRGLYGHAIHLSDHEIDRITEIDAGLVHCPTSNSFIGSGLFDMRGLKRRGIRIGLATDTGGGSSFSMLRTMASAYEIAQLRGEALHPSELLYLATLGSAEALHQSASVGSLEIGKYADFVIMDLHSTPAISQRSTQADDIWEALFATIMMGDDRAIKDVWIAGRSQKAEKA